MAEPIIIHGPRMTHESGKATRVRWHRRRWWQFWKPPMTVVWDVVDFDPNA